MFPTMYNSDILVELTGPLNKDRLKLQRKALKFARRYFRDFLIYLTELFIFNRITKKYHILKKLIC